MNHRRWAKASWLVLCVVAVAGSAGCAAVGPGCGGVVGCGVEPGCGLDPGCACGSSCGVAGYSYAGQKYCGDGGCGPCKPLINVCTGPCSCGVACEPGCGCEPGCAVEPGCGVGACGDVCGPGPCGCGPVGENLAFGLHAIGSEFRRLLSPLGICCPNGGCGGCGELYWSEWHSDPPACCDPCDDCGNWVGPPAGVMHGAQAPSFPPRRIAERPDAGPMLR